MTKIQPNDIFEKTSFLHGSNTVYIEQMYEKFRSNPKDVPSDWNEFFTNIKSKLENENLLRASWDKNSSQIKDEYLDTIDNYKFKEAQINRSSKNKEFETTDFKEQIIDSIRAIRLIRAYRVNGHLAANLDPLNLKEIKNYPELDFKNYGFQASDLSKRIFIDGSLGLNFATLEEIISVLKDTYCGSIGVEFVHIQDANQKQWVQE